MLLLSFMTLAVVSAGLPLAVAQPGQPPVAQTPTVTPISVVAASPTVTTYLYLPLVWREWPGQAVNPQDRQASLDFYQQHYLSSENVDAGWTGSFADCNPGNTSLAFRDAILRRINYFRAMAGVPSDVTLSIEYNRKAQAAALMMSVNHRLSHSPTPDWLCYSSDGAQGAGSSDLFLGVYGPAAITGYMLDPGDGNYFVGHRRWILYPQTKEMGTGDIPNAANYPAANALWVFDSNLWIPRPPTREEFVAWPPPGYVPYQVVFARWSFSYPQADFAAATVTMKRDGSSVPVSVASPAQGYGENTLVWIPMGLSNFQSWPRPTADTSYTVNIQNVDINGASRSFTYIVTVFDPSP